ncbi:hypothetical protein BDP27DRAFT_1428887 [Rhodocollybia butyracea]|uniref:Uncharacterized protein n=1 Tax=Rhodocollybia butyracea TaxID=206335 RepID=A0A9P5PE30_9AGAR|nr:hypothetical protein BDP27DRAFT_1428887 [Rhodocollybia butyracea]
MLRKAEISKNNLSAHALAPIPVDLYMSSSESSSSSISSGTTSVSFSTKSTSTASALESASDSTSDCSSSEDVESCVQSILHDADLLRLQAEASSFWNFDKSTTSDTDSLMDIKSGDSSTSSSSDPGYTDVFAPPKHQQVLHCQTRKELSEMYSQCYQVSRKAKEKPPPQLPFLLPTTKETKPADFREILRISPYTFDHLLVVIENDAVFTTNGLNA